MPYGPRSSDCDGAGAETGEVGGSGGMAVQLLYRTICNAMYRERRRENKYSFHTNYLYALEDTALLQSL